jgi:hypothetical protein
MALANMCFGDGPQSALGSDGARRVGIGMTTNEHRLLELLAGNTNGATCDPSVRISRMQNGTRSPTSPTRSARRIKQRRFIC